MHANLVAEISEGMVTVLPYIGSRRDGVKK
jgi:hypothetical protein